MAFNSASSSDSDSDSDTGDMRVPHSLTSMHNLWSGFSYHTHGHGHHHQQHHHNFDHVQPEAQHSSKDMRFPSVLEIKELRKRRRKDGYLSLDGRNVMLGGQNDKKNTLYSSEWLKEFINRQKLLEKSPLYRFLQMVVGRNATRLETFLRNDELDAGVKASVARAERLLRERREARLDTPAEQRRIGELQVRLASIVSQRDVWEEALRSAELAKNATLGTMRAIKVDVEPPERIKNADDWIKYFIRVSNANANNPTAYLSNRQTFEWIAQTAFDRNLNARLHKVEKAAAGPEDKETEEIRDILGLQPVAGELAYLWAVLRVLASPENGAVQIFANVIDSYVFIAGSAYSLDPKSYSSDLLRLFIISFGQGAKEPESNAFNSPILLQKMTLAFYHMVNSMIVRMGLVDGPLGRLIPTSEADAPRSNVTTVDDIEVMFDIEEEDLDALVRGQDVVSISRRHQEMIYKTLWLNPDPARASSILTRILRPFADAMYAHIFDIIHLMDTKSAFTPNFFRVPASIVLHTLLPENLHDIYSNFLEVNIDDGVYGFEYICFALTSVLRCDSHALEEYKHQRILAEFEAGGALDSLADYVASRVIAGRVPPFTKSTNDALIALHELPKTATSATRDNVQKAAIDALLRVHVDPYIPTNAVPGIVTLLKNPLARVYDIVYGDNNNITPKAQTQAKAEQKQLEVQLKALNRRLKKILQQEQASVKDSISAILEEMHVQSAREALSPEATGIVIVNEQFTGSVGEAYNYLEENVWEITQQMSIADLIESEGLSRQFASLVSATRRLIEARNPDQWQADATEERARLQVKSALERISMAFFRRLRAYEWQTIRCSAHQSSYARQFTATHGYGGVPGSREALSLARF